jgi:hypothetical protein
VTLLDDLYQLYADTLKALGPRRPEPEWRFSVDVWNELRTWAKEQGYPAPEAPTIGMRLFGWRVGVRDDLPPRTLGVWTNL